MLTYAFAPAILAPVPLPAMLTNQSARCRLRTPCTCS
jgi:hypothetical protein